MAYWLFKSEPESFSFDDLMAAPGHSTDWDGVRNFQARNFLRDSIAVGDGVLYYHSGTDAPGIAGLAEVVRAGHPDESAFDAKSHYHDPKSDPAKPTWYQVTIKGLQRIEPPITLSQLRAIPELADMELLRKGGRLSVQPVRAAEWTVIKRLAKRGKSKKG